MTVATIALSPSWSWTWTIGLGTRTAHLSVSIATASLRLKRLYSQSVRGGISVKGVRQTRRSLHITGTFRSADYPSALGLALFGSKLRWSLPRAPRFQPLSLKRSVVIRLVATDVSNAIRRAQLRPPQRSRSLRRPSLILDAQAQSVPRKGTTGSKGLLSGSLALIR